MPSVARVSSLNSSTASMGSATTAAVEDTQSGRGAKGGGQAGPGPEARSSKRPGTEKRPLSTRAIGALQKLASHVGHGLIGSRPALPVQVQQASADRLQRASDAWLASEKAFQAQQGEYQGLLQSQFVSKLFLDKGEKARLKKVVKQSRAKLDAQEHVLKHDQQVLKAARRKLTEQPMSYWEQALGGLAKDREKLQVQMQKPGLSDIDRARLNAHHVRLDAEIKNATANRDRMNPVKWQEKVIELRDGMQEHKRAIQDLDIAILHVKNRLRLETDSDALRDARTQLNSLREARSTEVGAYRAVKQEHAKAMRELVRLNPSAPGFVTGPGRPA